jgi:hypothetical protein
MLGNREEPAFRLHGLEVCTATNAAQPNFSAHARGRSCHLAKNDIHTVCIMLIDSFRPESDRSFTPMIKQCKTCFNPANVRPVMQNQG